MSAYKYKTQEGKDKHNACILYTSMEEQNKTAAKPYLLISVLDREITAEQFPSLEAAQAQMLAEIAQTGVADANNLHIGDCYDDFEIHEDNAWANHHGDNDWKIVELEVK